MSFFPSDFTGKEKDEETGYGYFGARYMDYELMTSWLSVDPMAGKYPNISPYAYCAWNPLLFIDPNGKEKVISMGNSEKDKQIASAANNYEDEEFVIHLWAHGLPDCVQVYDNNNKTHDIFSANDMHAFLSKESSLYQSNDQKNTLILIMHSCFTGQGENNIAQEISTGLNLLVFAPTEEIVILTENPGEANEYCFELGTLKQSKEGKTIGSGIWNVYYKGVLVDSISKNSAPMCNDPQSIIERYEEIYQHKIQE